MLGQAIPPQTAEAQGVTPVTERRVCVGWWGGQGAERAAKAERKDDRAQLCHLLCDPGKITQPL